MFVLNSRQVLMQYFEWYLPTEPPLWKKVKEDASHLKEIGITAIWLPPAFKGFGGLNNVGYGIYDLYDLGEFDQQGTIRTKYGTKDEYIQAITELQRNGIQVYADIVLNHKMGADGNEFVKAYEVNQYNKNEIIGNEELIEVPTLFTFPGRHQKYSDFTWDWTCFDGVDYDILSRRHATFLFKDKQWDQFVDQENGNFDYLMGVDIDFSNPRVLSELKKWGQWYLDLTHVDGFRLDAVKHIDAYFYRDWMKQMREYKQQDLFAVGEYWHGDVNKLCFYLEEVQYSFSLFDVPLHYHFYDASHAQGNYDMSQILKGTLVERAPQNAVTFVDNHDTQPSQGLQSWVDDWFKPLAYAFILLRQEGYPCLFYGDYYGIQGHVNVHLREVIEKMMKLRQRYDYDEQRDYFDDKHLIGWVRDYQKQHALVCVMTDYTAGYKDIYLGEEYTGVVFYDHLAHCSKQTIIDEKGYGRFYVEGGSVSVYIRYNEGG